LNNTEIKVGIICTLDDEYNACKEILDLNNESKISGRIISERKDNSVEVYAVKAGVGKINCSSATQLVIDKYLPDFVIDAGVAGSLTEDRDYQIKKEALKVA
jgi:adenosylhomocysteine nucleosidase